MNKNFKFRVAALAASLSAFGGSAFAALPAEATAAMTDMKADGALLAGAFLVVCIAIAAVKILRKGT